MISPAIKINAYKVVHMIVLTFMLYGGSSRSSGKPIKGGFTVLYHQKQVLILTFIFFYFLVLEEFHVILIMRVHYITPSLLQHRTSSTGCMLFKFATHTHVAYLGIPFMLCPALKYDVLYIRALEACLRLVSMLQESVHSHVVYNFI